MTDPRIKEAAEKLAKWPYSTVPGSREHAIFLSMCIAALEAERDRSLDMAACLVENNSPTSSNTKIGLYLAPSAAKKIMGIDEGQKCYAAAIRNLKSTGDV